jgi:hypothetical protein
VSLFNRRRYSLATIKEEMSVYGETNALYDDNDLDRVQGKFKDAKAEVVKLVDGQEIKFLKVLGPELCRELLEERLADTETKIKSSPELAQKEAMSTEVYFGYRQGLEGKRDDILRDIAELKQIDPTLERNDESI